MEARTTNALATGRAKGKRHRVLTVFARTAAVASLLITGGIALAACGASGGSGSEAGSVIKVGDYEPHTGAYAFAGVPAFKGASLEVEEVNREGGIDGKKIEFINGHAGSEPQEAKSIVHNFADEGVTAVFGPIGDNVSPSIAPVVKSLEVPDSSPTAVTLEFTKENPWTYTMNYPGEVTGKALCDIVSNFKYKRVAIVVTSSNAGQVAFKEGFEQCKGETGATVVSSQTVTDSTTNFSSVIANIKGANPDAIMVLLNGGSSSSFVKQAREAGVPKSIRFIGPETLTGGEFLEQAGESAVGSVGEASFAVGINRPQNKEFEQAYRAKYGEPAEVFAAMGYTAMQVLVAGLKNAGHHLTRSAVAAGMGKVKSMPTVLGDGTLTISSAHLPEYGVVYLEAMPGEKLRVMKVAPL